MVRTRSMNEISSPAKSPNWEPVTLFANQFLQLETIVIDSVPQFRQFAFPFVVIGMDVSVFLHP